MGLWFGLNKNFFFKKNALVTSILILLFTSSKPTTETLILCSNSSMQPLEQGEKCEYPFGEHTCQCCKCSYKLYYKKNVKNYLALNLKKLIMSCNKTFSWKSLLDM